MRFRSARRVAALLLLLLVAATGVVAGCGRTSMVGRRVDDLSAYYNKFYNARQAFDEATRPLDELEQPVDLATYLPVFPPPTQVQNEEAFTRAIDKSADLLRKHPQSKWVEDALLLIGKSYFYQGNYVGGERKFREVMEQSSPLEGEARFWLGRALFASGDLAGAERHLTESLAATDSLRERWVAHMQLLLGQVHVWQGTWASAADALKRGVQGVRDGQTRARAFVLRGQVLETMGRYADAAAAYRSAAGERPRYEVAYAAETSALRMAMRAGVQEQSAVLEQLRRLERNDKNKEKRPALALLRGQLYQAQGRPDRARKSYDELLYPGEERSAGQPSTPASVRGRAHYELGLLYRDVYGNYTRAAAHFDTAATALESPDRRRSAGSGAGRAPLPTAYAVTDSRRLADRYGRVAEASEAVARIDSLLRLGRMDEETFRAFVDSLRRAKVQQLEEAQEREARRRAERSFRQGGGGRQEGRGRRSPGGAPAGSDESGFLFHRNATKVAQALRSFRQQWGERPRVPNWRRREAISTQADAQVPGDPSKTVGPQQERPAAGLPQVDVSAVPRRPEERDELRFERASARYNLGNALLLSAQQPDSAAVWFRRVIEAGADTAVVRRARYALAEAERAAGRLEEARRHYRRVAREQRGTKLARQAMQHLDGASPASPGGGSGDASPARPTSATVREAENAYARAHRTWKSAGNEQAALRDFLRVAATYPEARVAPRALWAAARLSAAWNRRTGRPLTDSLPVAVPEEARSLLADDRPAADSSAASADSSAASTDTTSAAPADADEEASSTAAPTLTLNRLLTVLARRFPDAPHADRARRMKRALHERYSDHFAPASAEADAAAPRDSAAAALPRDSTAVPADSTADGRPAAEQRRTDRRERAAAQRKRRMRVARARKEQQQTTEAARPAVQTDSAQADSVRTPVDDGGPPVPAQRDSSAERWTIVVASDTSYSREAARAQAQRLAPRFEILSAGLLNSEGEDGASRYRVALGQFSTRTEAEAAYRRHRSSLPSSSRVVKASEPPQPLEETQREDAAKAEKIRGANSASEKEGASKKKASEEQASPVEQK